MPKSNYLSFLRHVAGSSDRPREYASSNVYIGSARLRLEGRAPVRSGAAREARVPARVTW
jgi:hypothetical protein